MEKDPDSMDSYREIPMRHCVFQQEVHSGKVVAMKVSDRDSYRRYNYCRHRGVWPHGAWSNDRATRDSCHGILEKRNGRVAHRSGNSRLGQARYGSKSFWDDQCFG